MSKEDDIQSIRKSFSDNYNPKNDLNGDFILNFHNALIVISDEVYQKCNHFIFELLQNCNDSKYSNDGPRFVSFLLEKRDPLSVGAYGALVLLNSECGFTLEGMKAIYSIGQSTKKLQVGNLQKAFIGEKGIGFKSVGSFLLYFSFINF